MKGKSPESLEYYPWLFQETPESRRSQECQIRVRRSRLFCTLGKARKVWKIVSWLSGIFQEFLESQGSMDTPIDFPTFSLAFPHMHKILQSQEFSAKIDPGEFRTPFSRVNSILIKRQNATNSRNFLPIFFSRFLTLHHTPLSEHLNKLNYKNNRTKFVLLQFCC